MDTAAHAANHNDRDLVNALLNASAAIERRLDGALSSIKGISFSEFQLLHALHGASGPATTRVGLAETVGLTASGVTRALKPLEKLGFVETTKDTRDARRSLASLTPAGVELVTDAEGVVDDTIATLDGITALTPDNRDELGALLRSLR